MLCWACRPTLGKHFSSTGEPVCPVYIKKPAVCVFTCVCVREKQKTRPSFLQMEFWAPVGCQVLVFCCSLDQEATMPSFVENVVFCPCCVCTRTVTISPSDRPSLEGKRKTGKRETEAEKQRCRQKNEKNRWIDEWGWNKMDNAQEKGAKNI